MPVAFKLRARVWTGQTEIGSRIRLRDLHILLAVAESGSMSKAATQLAISHPVVSKTISDLEQTVGVRLFDRTSQGVELTAYGQTLLKCGVLVFDEMRQGLKQIKFLTDPNSGELRIGCREIMVVGLLPAILERFWRRHPRIRVHVVHAYTAMQQFQELRARNVELLIGLMPLTPFQEEDFSSSLCSTSRLSRWPEITADGRGDGKSVWQNWSTSRGCCRPTTAQGAR